MVKVLQEFQRFSRCPRKMVFVFLKQFSDFKAWIHYFQPYKIRFRLLTGFKTTLWETQIQGKDFGRVSTFASLFHKNGFVFVNQFLQFKALSHYFQPQKIRLRLQNDFIGNSNRGRRFWKSLNVCLAFPQKWFFIRQPIFAF